MVTDGSKLYPAVVWPATRHRLCISHVLKELHKFVLDPVRRLRQALSRRGNRGRKPRRGRRPKSRAIDVA